MTDNDIIKALDILHKLDFFYGQRAGRDLWNSKPFDVQNQDIKEFSNDMAFLEEFINRQKEEIERLRELNMLVTEAGQEWQKRYDTARAETITEFETKLTMHFGTYTDKDYLRVFDMICLIKQIAEEVKGEQE